MRYERCIACPYDVLSLMKSSVESMDLIMIFIQLDFLNFKGNKYRIRMQNNVNMYIYIYNDAHLQH